MVAYALLLLAPQTGLRLSELIGLDRDAVTLGRGTNVRCIGKGRKERCTPLSKTVHRRNRPGVNATADGLVAFRHDPCLLIRQPFPPPTGTREDLQPTNRLLIPGLKRKL